MLSDRRKIVVFTDEAHRSQYEFIEGFARNLRDGLPNASCDVRQGHVPLLPAGHRHAQA